jgi:hypothetical protein
MLWAKIIFYFTINQYIAKSFGHKIIWLGIPLDTIFALYIVDRDLQLYYRINIIIATVGGAIQFIDSSLITS